MIRCATQADLATLTTLESECFGAAAWDADALRTELTRGFILIDDHQPVYAVGMPIVDECELLRIGTHPSARRRGLGRRILVAFHNECQRRGLHQVLLEVRDDNHSARALYESCGYHIAGTRRNYYPERNGRRRADAILYALTIKPTVIESL